MSGNRPVSFWKSIDWWTVAMYLIMIVAGWFTICGASYSFDIDALFAMGSRPMMQTLWIGLGVLIAFSVLMIDSTVFEVGAPLFYASMLGLLFVTIFVAPDIKGSHSWLVIGPLRLQPAEFAKVATALVLGWQCGKYGFSILSIRSYVIVFSLVLVPVLLILGQRETGSALVFFALFLALYREGFSGLFLGLAGCATLYFVLALIYQDALGFGGTTELDLWVVGNCIIVLTLIFYAVYAGHKGVSKRTMILVSVALLAQLVGVVLHSFLPMDLSWITLGSILALVGYLLYMWLREYVLSYLFIGAFALGSLGFFYSVSYVFDNIMEPHQQVRIKVALGIENDPKGKGYNVEQSKIAIGSGGLWGKGFLKGTQTKLNYVPEQETDFILCTVGEEFGFVGTTGLLLFYGIFIMRLVALAERQTSIFARVYGYSVASIFLFHLFINVGMVIGLIPVIGIPLPFFSYGGSSMWGFSLLLFIFLGLDARRYSRHL